MARGVSLSHADSEAFFGEKPRINARNNFCWFKMLLALVFKACTHFFCTHTRVHRSGVSGLPHSFSLLFETRSPLLSAPSSLACPLLQHLFGLPVVPLYLSAWP